jgi:hypothetical protein
MSPIPGVPLINVLETNLALHNLYEPTAASAK